MKFGRREFLKGSILLGTAALLAPKNVYSQAVDSRIEILVNEPIGTVNPNLYSHFVEHLGGVVYDGIWVGEKFQGPEHKRYSQGARRQSRKDQTRRDPLS